SDYLRFTVTVGDGVDLPTPAVVTAVVASHLVQLRWTVVDDVTVGGLFMRGRELPAAHSQDGGAEGEVDGGNADRVFTVLVDVLLRLVREPLFNAGTREASVCTLAPFDRFGEPGLRDVVGGRPGNPFVFLLALEGRLRLGVL